MELRKIAPGRAGRAQSRDALMTVTLLNGVRVARAQRECRTSKRRRDFAVLPE
jgi:hypothetical protein